MSFILGFITGALVTAFVPKVFEYVVYVGQAALAYAKSFKK